MWREENLETHRSETFKYSNDPQLVEKVTDVVGLYLDPPERAIVKIPQGLDFPPRVASWH